MSDQTSFFYETLELPTHIRLVELLPSEDLDDEISCQVRVVNLDESPMYEAVSYEWGSEADKAEILCGGSALQVPRNLIAALRRFRRSITSRLLWADSICINQANIPEKNQQVRIMGRIFAGATTVLIWLGEAEEEYTKQVVQGLHTLIEFATSGRLDELSQDLLVTRPRDEDGNSIFDLINILLDTSAGVSTDIKAVIRIFARGWFRRAWTFQESFLAKERRAFIGCLEIMALELQIAMHTLEICSFSMPESWRSVVHGKRSIFQAITIMPADINKHATLGSLMSSRRGCECKHAVDLVYSLLEVAEDAKSMVPDYNKDFPQVFAESMMAIIQADGSLAALDEVDVVPRLTTSELPSWMPDWRTVKTKSDILESNASLFSCAGTTRPRFSISPDSRKMTISGFVIDSIRGLLLPLEAWNRLEAQEDMGAAWVRVLCCDLDNLAPGSAPRRRWDQSTYDVYNAVIAHLVQSQSNGTTAEVSAAFISRIGLDAAYKRVMTTECERTGVAPTNAEPGDLVTVLFGGQVPVLLRPTAKTNEFLFVGQCYVDQMMDGEALEQLANLQNRAGRSRMTRLLQRCSSTVSGLALPTNPNLQLYRVRDFVLV